MNLESIKKIYFLGIGGIGMSALARYFNGLGIEIHGYDKTETDLTKKLEEEGMNIHYEEDLNQIPEGIDLVVLTPAIPAKHRELLHFQDKGFPIKKRAEVLGIISRSRKTIAVAGTHGKTTTSSIVTHLLRSGGIDCTAFLGGIAFNQGSNFVEGKSEWVVAEADEYDRSFLHLSPDIAVILSMDADHLDIYGDRETLLETGFRAFARKIKPDGKLWIQYNWKEELGSDFSPATYGVENGVAQSQHVRVEQGFFTFDYVGPKAEMKALQLAMPGRHNIENATVAISIALDLGISESAIRSALLSFKGVKRRFEFLYRDEKRAYIDDYAHHPSELTAAIGAARQLFPDRKLVGVFQPHLFSRTRDFADGFAEALDGLDEPWLMDIYPARELPIEGVNSDMLLQKMANPQKRKVSQAELMVAIEKRKPDLLLTLGAGDIDLFRAPIKTYFENSK
ncbi:MAG TPA: UDP-N-acetylmuramate--L-alanine ligase [Saprospiraceae bacterium]|nr:UDP-N-acetylmuramate--L-alanine ligase [Saprospiraceae bacterium]HMQ81795.1 UDP-N-acetylmuramate--L-alanine ligase [Saprospiraceae bacterium]